MSISLNSIYAPLPSTARASTTHLSYDPKTNRIAYPSGKTVVIRSLSDPTKSLQFLKHNYTTTVAKFSTSGYYIASGDESGNVKVWDSIDKTTLGGGATNKEIFEEPILKSEFQILSGRINDLTWDSESKRIIAVGNGKEKFGHCFTFDSGNSVGEISGHSAQINSVSIRPVRPFRAITASDDNALVWYHGPPFKFQSSIRGYHSNFVKDVKFSPDGEYIVSVGSDKKINIYDGKTGEFKKEIENDHTGGIFSVSWFEDSSKFVTCSGDCSVRVWNIDGDNLSTYQFDSKIDNQQLGVIVTKDSIVSLSFNGNLNILDKETLKPTEILTGHQKNITSLLIKGDDLYTGSSDGKIFEWDLQKGLPAPIKGDSHENYVVGLVETESSIKSVGWDDKLKNLVKGEFTSDSKLPSQPKYIGSYSKGFGILYENAIELYNTKEEKIAETKLNYNSITMSICDEYIIVGTSTNSILKYDLKLNSIQTPELKLRAPPSTISISPDSSKFSVGDNTGKIILYKSDFEVITTRWSFHNSKITSIDWLDELFIVSGSLDTNIMIYSVEKPSKNIKLFGGHKDGVNVVKWVSGKEIITGGNDGCVKRWDVDLSVY